MSSQRYISLRKFCIFHDLSQETVLEVETYGLIKLDKREDDCYIAESALPDLERILRLHTELGINFAGIETILYMRERMAQMQDEMDGLRTELRQLALRYRQEDVEDIG